MKQRQPDPNESVFSSSMRVVRQAANWVLSIYYQPTETVTQTQNQNTVDLEHPETQNDTVISSSPDKAIVTYQPQTHVQPPSDGYAFWNNIPEEIIITGIFQYLPLAHVWLRAVNRQFKDFFDPAARLQLRNSTPLTRGLRINEGVNLLIAAQKEEINYLTHKKEEILEKNSDISAELNQLFDKLVNILEIPNMVSYFEREKYLNDINAAIIRNKIAAAQKKTWWGGYFYFYLNHCHLTRFPDGLFSDETLQGFWSKISGLELSNNMLTVLPDDIGKCTALKALDVKDNKITFLPKGIEKCTELSILNVRNNKITFLPESIGQCTSLDYLDAGNNEIRYLPVSLGQCANLHRLIVCHNLLDTLPDSIVKCTKLLKLDVSHNKFKDLSNIGQFTQLIELYADYNEIAFLPDLSFTRLVKLSVVGNKITFLPDSITLCESLDSLAITENYLSKFPDDLSEDINFFNAERVLITKGQCLASQKVLRIEDEEKEKNTIRFN